MPQLNDNINIQMVDLNRQYLRIKDDVDSSIQAVINEARFVKGKIVRDFEENLEKYFSPEFVILKCDPLIEASLILFTFNSFFLKIMFIPEFSFSVKNKSFDKFENFVKSSEKSFFKLDLLKLKNSLSIQD